MEKTLKSAARAADKKMPARPAVDGAAAKKPPAAAAIEADELDQAPRQPQSGNPPLTISRKELLADGSDRDFRRLVHGLLPFLAIHTAIRDSYASLLGLTGPEYTILLCIRNLNVEGPVSVKVVADHLRLSGSFITAQTKSLEKNGFVRKERATEDRRLVSLSLTPKGRALLDSIAELRQQVNDVQFECLSNDEFKMLVPLIERLIPSGERALALLNYLSAQMRANDGE